MPEGGADEISRAKMIHIDIAGYLGDAVVQEELGGLGGLVAREIEIRPTGAPRPDAKGIVEAQIATCLHATFERGTPGNTIMFWTVACYNSRC